MLLQKQNRCFHCYSPIREVDHRSSWTKKLSNLVHHFPALFLFSRSLSDLPLIEASDQYTISNCSNQGMFFISLKSNTKVCPSQVCSLDAQSCPMRESQFSRNMLHFHPLRSDGSIRSKITKPIPRSSNPAQHICFLL